MSCQTEHADRIPRVLTTALVLSGFTAVVAQVVLIRELLVVVYGNELSIGIAMALWLLWTAVGSGWLGRIGRTFSARTLTALLLIAESPAIFASLFLIHSSRHWWNAVPGELLAPLQVIATATAALALVCPIAGWLFAVGARAYAEASGQGAEASGSTMYLLEAVGSACGGVLASVVFFQVFDSLQIAALLSASNLLVASWMLLRGKLLRAAASAFVLIAAISGIALLPRVQLRLVQAAWPGFHILATANSRYGNLAAVESEGNRSAVQNGLVLFTAPDPPAAEEAVHFPLLEHASPASVLMIGGGLNGSIAEVLRHPTVARVDYVELDPAVLRMAQQYLPQAWSSIASDSRVHVHVEDGRLFVKSTEQRFDVIIINLPDPQTAQLNRFYTEEFFSEAVIRLNAGGILAIHLHGAEEYISPGLVEFLASIHHTLRRVFAQVIAIPGEEVHLLASNDSASLTTDPEVLLGRLRQRRIQTSYVREYYLPARMAQDRIADLREQLAAVEGRANRDFAPSAYYFSIALWGSQFSNTYRDLFRLAAKVPFPTTVLLVALCTLFLVLIFSVRRDLEHRKAASARFAIASSGLSVMGLEIILLLGFEAIYGYVFDEIAIIVASFMAGMALGSGTSMRSSPSIRTLPLRLLMAQMAITVLPVGVVGLLWVADAVHGRWISAFIAHAMIPAIAVGCGALGGYQFPLALEIARGGTHATGKLYGLDLAGAAIGAIALSTYLLPVFGFVNAALLISVPSAGAVVLICTSGAFSGSSTPSARDLKTPAR